GQNLNILPIARQQIETIKYSAAPQIYASLPVQSGFMDLQTTPADSGFSAFGSLTLGNQTEDPGPWAYDSSKVTPNIDRRGPHYFGGLSYLSDNWQARVRLSLRQHQPTNINNNHRIASYSFVDSTWHTVKSVVTNGRADNTAHLPNGLQILKLISTTAAFKAGYCLATMMSTSFFNLTAARFLLILLIANGPFKDIAWLENGA